MIVLWYDPKTDEYTLKEGECAEKLSRMAGEFLCCCIRNNERMQEEIRGMRATEKKLRNLLEQVGVVEYGF